jgi:HSP20 family protein
VVHGIGDPAGWHPGCLFSWRVRTQLRRIANRKEGAIMPAKDPNLAPVKVQSATAAQPTARQESATSSPFRTLERFADEVTRIFDDFGLGRGWSRVPATNDLLAWAPRVDVTRHEDEVLIRADLPGLGKDDVKVNVTEDAVTIHGERHRAQEEERDGVYRAERNYGAFYRTVPLPAGTRTDQAKASFKNGVLEIRMPAAQTVEGRPLEIAG